MFKIALTRATSDWGMKYLNRFAETNVIGVNTPNEIVPRCKGMDALLCRGVGDMSEALFRGLAEENVKVVASHGTGLDGCDLSAATKYGIPVVYAPGANARSVAEYTVSAMLAMIKEINICTEQAHSGNFSAKWQYKTREFRNMNLYVIGFGNIGRQVAEMCHGLGMNIMVHDKYVSRSQVEALGYKHYQNLYDGLPEADIVTLHTPLTDETRGIAGTKMFDKMKRGSYFINTARGDLVDEDEICRRIENGHLAGAALDATSIDSGQPNPRLLACKKIVLSYHIAAMTEEALNAMAKDCADGIESVLNQKRWEKTANPEVYDKLGW